MVPILTKLTTIEFNSAKHLVEEFDYSVWDANVYDQYAQLPETIKRKPRVGELFGRFGFAMQYSGSGTRGTASKLSTLFTACGLNEQVNPATSVIYTPQGPGYVGNATLDAFIGNTLKHSLTKAAGNLIFEFMAGQPCKLRGSFEGLYTEPTTASSAASRSTDALEPICKSLAATIGSASLVLKMLRINLGNKLKSPRSDATQAGGCQPPVITSQLPIIEATFEAPALATLNLFNKFTSETKLAFSAVLGSASGNTHTFAVDGFMNKFPAASDVDEILEQTITCDMSRESGDTQLTITQT